MADTNFAAMTTHAKKVWSRDIWKVARNSSFLFNFMGSTPNAMIQRITELTRTERGDRAVLTLVPDLEEDGIVGDAALEGNEEAITAYDKEIVIDMLRHANRSSGKMGDQKSIVNFRSTSKDVLGYWLGDRLDQMGFLSLAGMPYTLKTNGALRTEHANTAKNISTLSFAPHATNDAPSTARHVQWDADSSALVTATASTRQSLVAADTPTYKMLVLAKAYAKEQYIKGIRGSGGEEVYHVFMNPTGMAKLKLDSDYIQNVRNAYQRGASNPLFAGTTSVMADGLVIHEYRHVPNTLGATSGGGSAGDLGYKWGAGNDVDGQRALMCGAQALGFCDLGTPEWNEEWFDYKNKGGISIGKMFGFLKPNFHSPVNGNSQDFGVLAIDTAI
jgi:N4-gp56 family major capsid protein